jgi:hypothetical protein
MKLTLGLSLLAFLILSGCEVTQHSKGLNQDSLQRYISDLDCDASFQCKVIGVGERAACGGASRFVIFSTKTVDEREVEKLANQITTKERNLNKTVDSEEGCKQVLPIQSLCIRNRCESFPIKN